MLAAPLAVLCILTADVTDAGVISEVIKSSVDHAEKSIDAVQASASSAASAIKVIGPAIQLLPGREETSGIGMTSGAGGLRERGHWDHTGKQPRFLLLGTLGGLLVTWYFASDAAPDLAEPSHYTFQQSESNDRTGLVEGSYSVNLPDGRVQTVHDLTGNIAKIPAVEVPAQPFAANYVNRYGYAVPQANAGYAGYAAAPEMWSPGPAGYAYPKLYVPVVRAAASVVSAPVRWVPVPAPVAYDAAPVDPAATPVESEGYAAAYPRWYVPKVHASVPVGPAAAPVDPAATPVEPEGNAPVVPATAPVVPAAAPATAPVVPAAAPATTPVVPATAPVVHTAAAPA